MITIENIKEIESEITRFQKKLKAAKERIKDPNYSLYSGSREVGALKRASMDLSNELLKLRK